MNQQQQQQRAQPNMNMNMNNGANMMAGPNYHDPYQANQIPPNFQPHAFFSDPVVSSMAAKYGANLADQGKEYVTKNVDKWLSVSKLKYYFAVDTNYVSKKLSIMLFPFLNRDWSIKYSQSDDTQAVPPKLDVNAPDMYIPLMAFVTYLLVVGVALGVQKKFTPEVLGMQATSALAWFVFEVLAIFITLQILGLKTALKTFDIIAFGGYKYFGMIICLLTGIFASKNAYYLVLLYVCASFSYFMARSLKVLILTTDSSGEAGPSSYQQNIDHSHGNKRRIYVLLFISLIQPIFIWWLTFSINN